MDLIGGYLLVILILFAANIGLLFGNFKFSNVKLVGISAMFFAATFIMIYASSFLNNSLSFMWDYFSYLFFVIFAVLIVSVIFYIKNDRFKPALYLILPVSLISIIFLSSQADWDIISMILYSLCVFIILFVVYQLSKLLHHAKRQYSAIIGEYMCLFAILMFIFALTYDSARTLDYTAFSPFLILTPTYQLIYIVIVIVVILVMGVFINDRKGGNS
ncbi:peptide ABC transporter permease [Methanobrevibacter sp.]|uniref:peptide ABC transporter permease n=1 Tax=Methanobrevibacter sp. TaxID=66852 RepID=UPI0038907C73